MKTLSTTNSINRSPLRYGLLVILLLFALWATPGTARGQMFVTVNAQPFTNDSGLIYQYDPTGTYSTFLDNSAPHPRGLAFDSAGNLYVATFTWVLDSDGNILGTDHGSILRISGGVTTTFATFSGGTATAVATDSAGNVFASSQLPGDSSSTIYKVTPNGTKSTFGSVPGQCFSLAFDNTPPPNGPILFAAGADSTLTYGTIYEFTPAGERSIFAGSGAFSSGDSPIGMTFGASGNLFVSTINNDGNGKIRSFDSTGMEILPEFATGLTKNPRGLAFDSDSITSNLFVAEIGAGASPGDILKFDSNGVQSVFATEGFGTRQNRGPEYLTFAPPAVTVTPPSTGVTLTFPDSTEPLTTTVVTSLDQNSVPQPPSNFELSSNVNLAFEITSSGSLTPPIIIGFTVPSSLDVSTLKALHYENGNWVDSTIYPTDPNYPTSPAPNTVYASVNSLSPFLVAAFKFGARVQQPINADGTSVFTAKRGVIPVAFKLTSDGAPTCQLPPATISVFRTSGGVVGSIDESTYLLKSDSGSNFRIDSTKCQYVYNLGASSLGPGTYKAYISIGGSVAGSATFALK
jgi:sugar lactone lactonase YvrE